MQPAVQPMVRQVTAKNRCMAIGARIIRQLQAKPREAKANRDGPGRAQLSKSNWQLVDGWKQLNRFLGAMAIGCPARSLESSPGHTGCSYTGKSGGAIVMDTPTSICANDAAEMASTPSASNSERMEKIMRIVLPSARSSFAYPILLSRCGLRRLKGAIFGRILLHVLRYRLA
jgi:hypothetical protein